MTEWEPENRRRRRGRARAAGRPGSGRRGHPRPTDPIEGLADSKKLTARRREHLAEQIMARRWPFGGHHFGHVKSTGSISCRPPWPACASAWNRLNPAAGAGRIDGNRAPDFDACPAKPWSAVMPLTRPSVPPASSPRPGATRSCWAAPALSALWLRPPQGLPHRRPPGPGTENSTAPALSTASASARSPSSSFLDPSKHKPLHSPPSFGST
jgi:hypothetical protein